MKTLEISLSTGTCKIHVNESIKNLEKYLSNGRNVILTDKTVRHIYGDFFSNYDVIEIGVGEKIKNIKTVERIYQRFLELEMDRFSFVIGIGGGVVCDIAGFVASTYMRGLHFGFVPSTLVAQVDASIGGKNGINVKGYKNIVGVFNQPRFVLVDLKFLNTLPKKELQCGVAEIIKHALIKNRPLFDYIEKEWQSILSLSDDVVERVVVESIKLKSEIVQIDEKEAEGRKKLNFGHTLGHAIEKISRLRHGEAISIGMVLASNISVAKGMLSADDALQIKTLLQNVKLPTKIPVKAESLKDVIKKDLTGVVHPVTLFASISPSLNCFLPCIWRVVGDEPAVGSGSESPVGVPHL